MHLSSSFYDLYLSYLMNDAHLKDHYEAFIASEIEDSHLTYLKSIRVFIGGLAAFQLYRETCDSLWKNRASEQMKTVKLWAEQGSQWNFEHKLCLMEAEDYYCSSNYEQAAISYEKAISSAKRHKYINEDALACELAGKFFLEKGDFDLSLKYLKLAHKNYSEWGAHGKAAQLYSTISANFACHLGVVEPDVAEMINMFDV